MNFWWVNHKQTFRQEFFGKYIWCPRRKKNGQVNRFYESMRALAPGDIVFSFANAAIQGFGIAQTQSYWLFNCKEKLISKSRKFELEAVHLVIYSSKP
jgi:hypothetical protein